MLPWLFYPKSIDYFLKGFSSLAVIGHIFSDNNLFLVGIDSSRFCSLPIWQLIQSTCLIC